MNISLRARLEAAYRDTAYRVHLPDGPVDIRIGIINPRLDRWLYELGVQCWAFVSAGNPRSKMLSTEENISRHRTLVDRARQHGWRTLDGEGVADDPGWPPERSLMIAGIDQIEALRLAREFEQLAIVTGRCGAPAQLVWLDADT